MKHNKNSTVCMCAYNAEQFLGRAVKSVLSQSYTDFQLYIVNDGSTDGTLAAAKQFVSDPRVTVINLHKNVGTYAGKNFVLKHFGQGEFWFNHDSDDYSEPHRFERQIAYLEEQKLDGCGTAIDEFYAPGIEPRIPSDAPLVFESDGYRHRVNQYPLEVTIENISQDIEDLPKLKIAMNGSIAFRMAALKDLGGFDGRTPIGGDSEFLWRFVKFYRFGNTPEMLYHRQFHSASLTQAKDTGHSSELRKQYAQKALEKHKTGLDVLSRGDRALALSHAREDMFCPDVPFDIISQS